MKTDLDVTEFLAALQVATVGTKKICNCEDHQPQFRAFSDVITCRVLDALIWACRTGSKTFLFGGLDTWAKSCSKGRYETKILGGSKDQSLLSYEAMRLFRDVTDPSNSRLSRDIMMTRAEFNNQSKVSILTASRTSVRGPHPQCLKLDEVDEIDNTIYEDALSQPMSKFGHSSSLIMFSTNHNINGQMDLALKNAKDKNIGIYKYCVFECLESCRDYRCSTCPLTSICPGEQMKGADGYYKITDFIKKLNTLSYSMLSRDWLCIKVGLGDLVYEQEWDEKVHLVSVSLMQKPVKLSIDFGGVHPFSVGVWQEAPPELGGQGTWIRVTELYMQSSEESTTNGKVIARAKKAPWWKLVDEVIPDSARPDLIQEWREALPNARFTLVKKDIDGMIERVKAALKPVLGAPKLLVNRICMHIRQEMTMYKVKNRKPVDADNHCYDDKTELLTKHGWKLFRDLNGTEEVASLDNNRKLLWVKPSAYQEFDYSGEMIQYSARNLDFCVTPNHNMLVVSQFDAKKSKEYNPRLIPIKDIIEATGRQNKGKRNQASRWWIPVKCLTESQTPYRHKIDGYFLGFWLAEGCKSVSGFGAKYVHIDNTNIDLLNKAQNCIGFHNKPYKVLHCYRVSIRSDELYDILPKQRSWEKRIPRWFIETAPVCQLERLYQGMMDGDGCWQKASSHYDSCNKNLVSDFHELLIRIGMNGALRQVGSVGSVSYIQGREVISKHNQYRITINTDKYIYKVMKGENLIKVPYSGKVYCVTVEPYHTILVRRNGYAMWCGQTLDETGYFCLAKMGIGGGTYVGTTSRDITPR